MARLAERVIPEWSRNKVHGKKYDNFLLDYIVLPFIVI